MSSNRTVRFFLQLTLRRGLIALLMLLAMPGLLACTKFFGDAKRPTADMKVQGSMNCFDQAGATLNDYVAGQVPLAQMDALIDCTSSSVDEFTSKVLGAAGQPNTYNQTDIKVFLGSIPSHQRKV